MIETMALSFYQYDNLPYKEYSVGEETFKNVHPGDFVYWKLAKPKRIGDVVYDFFEKRVLKVDSSGTIFVPGKLRGTSYSLPIRAKVKVECQHNK